MNINDVVQQITIEDAKQYIAQRGEWWIWIEENILEPNNLQTNERNVHLVENRIFAIVENPFLVLTC